MRYSSHNTDVMASLHASSFLGMVSFTDLGSTSRNQQRSQLSSAYCTTSRNGGEVTTSETESGGSLCVLSAGTLSSSARSATAANVPRTTVVTSPSSCDFLKMQSATCRRGGCWSRFALILRCDWMDT